MGYMKKSHEAICKFILLFFFFNYMEISFVQNPSWESIGPEGGFISAVVQDPVNNNILYAIANECIEFFGWLLATEQCIVVKSTNFGESWFYTNQSKYLNLSSVNIFPDAFPYLSIDPFNTEILYAIDHNIYKSTDAGNSWYKVDFSNEDKYRISALALDPQDHNNIYACGNYGTFFKSSDQGSTWNKINYQMILK